MSVSFEIKSSVGSYGIRIATNAAEKLLSEVADSIVICDQFFEAKLKINHSQVVAVEATENAKKLDKMSEIIIKLREAGATRDSSIVAVGGGVIQDIATFCASIFMRGIPWYYVPTTLLGMVDSCIGGKSSINVGNYKNIVGNFYPPQAIVIDPIFVSSLTIEQRIAGLCEAVKICFARGDEAFNTYLAFNPVVDMPLERFSQVIEMSLLAKKWFIEIDEFDRNERLLLNFGHTFGHAIEGATNFAVSHGVAVGLGMIAAANYAVCKGISTAQNSRIQNLIDYVSDLLIGVSDLHAALSTATVDAAFEKFSSDKKHGKDFYTVIIPSATGMLERIRIPRDVENQKLIRQVFDSIITRWSN